MLGLIIFGSLYVQSLKTHYLMQYRFKDIKIDKSLNKVN